MYTLPYNRKEIQAIINEAGLDIDLNPKGLSPEEECFNRNI